MSCNRSLVQVSNGRAESPCHPGFRSAGYRLSNARTNNATSGCGLLVAGLVLARAACLWPIGLAERLGESGSAILRRGRFVDWERQDASRAAPVSNRYHLPHRGLGDGSLRALKKHRRALCPGCANHGQVVPGPQTQSEAPGARAQDERRRVPGLLVQEDGELRCEGKIAYSHARLSRAARCDLV